MSHTEEVALRAAREELEFRIARHFDRLPIGHLLEVEFTRREYENPITIGVRFTLPGPYKPVRHSVQTEWEGPDSWDGFVLQVENVLALHASAFPRCVEVPTNAAETAYRFVHAMLHPESAYRHGLDLTQRPGNESGPTDTIVVALELIAEHWTEVATEDQRMEVWGTATRVAMRRLQQLGASTDALTSRVLTALLILADRWGIPGRWAPDDFAGGWHPPLFSPATDLPVGPEGDRGDHGKGG